MSHADAWACVALDLLKSWRLIPIAMVLAFPAMRDSDSTADGKACCDLMTCVGVIWLFIDIGYLAEWWK